MLLFALNTWLWECICVFIGLSLENCYNSWVPNKTEMSQFWFVYPTWQVILQTMVSLKFSLEMKLQDCYCFFAQKITLSFYCLFGLCYPYRTYNYPTKFLFRKIFVPKQKVGHVCPTKHFSEQKVCPLQNLKIYS